MIYDCECTRFSQQGTWTVQVVIAIDVLMYFSSLILIKPPGLWTAAIQRINYILELIQFEVVKWQPF